MIIALSGYAGVGKDTVADVICELYPGWQVKRFAGKLKEVASILTGLKVEDFEDRLIKSMQLEGWDMTVREFLQRLGTEAIRDNLHKDAWVNALISEYNRSMKFEQFCPICGNSWNTSICSTCNTSKLETKCTTNWIVTDCRFKNEAEQIKNCGGYVIRIKRPFTKPVNYHQSEVDLDDYEFDYTLHNDKEIDYLETKVKFMFRQLNLC